MLRNRFNLRPSNGGSLCASMLLIGALAAGGAPRAAHACTGGTPKAPACNLPRCTADGWTFWPVAAATSCNNGLGYCDGGILGPPGQIEPEAQGVCISGIDYKPRFQLQSIIYMPPGKQSSVSYSTGSGEGGRNTYQTTTSTNGVATLKIGGFGGSTSYTEGTVYGNSLSVSKLDTYTRGETVNTGLDAPVRGSDLFDLWFNAKATDYYSTNNGWEMISWATSDGAGPLVYTFSGDELLGNKSVSQSDPVRYQYFLSLTATDKQAIIFMNAPLNGAALDPKRYQLVEQQFPSAVMYGPDYVGAPVNSYTYNIGYTSSQDQINGSFINSSNTVLVGINVWFVSVGGSLTWTQNFADTRTLTQSQQKAASVTLRTPTVGCYMTVNSYIDAAFGTYLVVPTYSASCN